MPVFEPVKIELIRVGTEFFFGCDYKIMVFTLIKGALTMIRILIKSKPEFNTSTYIISLVGMKATDNISRQLSLDILELIGGDDSITARILRKKNEILSDPDQLKQILNKALKRLDNISNWPVLTDLKVLKDSELVEIIKLVDAKRISNYFLSELGAEKLVLCDSELPTHLFSLLSAASSETVEDLRLSIEAFLQFEQNDCNYIFAVTNLIRNSVSFELTHATLLKKILLKSIELTRASIDISKAVEFLISEMDSKLLSSIIIPTEANDLAHSVIKVTYNIW